MTSAERHFFIDESSEGLRFDQAVHVFLPEYSRSALQDWIKSGDIRLNGLVQKPKTPVKVGDQIEIYASLEPTELDDVPEAIPLDIIFEDEHLMVINKPVGLVVHPGAGTPSGTLMNGLLHYRPEQGLLPRAGIVHRLDKDTSGLMVVAKTELARSRLIESLKEHEVGRTYWAFVHGYVVGGFTVEGNIGRHPKVRTKMAVVPEELGGKYAITHVRVLARSKVFSCLEVSLETGRTHQIRVHLSDRGYPLIGDVLYGGRTVFSGGERLERQALHAGKLSFSHPITLETVEFEAPLPADLARLKTILDEKKE